MKRAERSRACLGNKIGVHSNVLDGKQEEILPRERESSRGYRVKGLWTIFKKTD